VTKGLVAGRGIKQFNRNRELDMKSGEQVAMQREGRTLRLNGNVSEISRSELYQDGQERITVSVEGAEPLYAELRLHNVLGWMVGQRLVLVIITSSEKNVWESLT
jgi:hypothetical protein